MTELLALMTVLWLQAGPRLARVIRRFLADLGDTDGRGGRT